MPLQGGLDSSTLRVKRKTQRGHRSRRDSTTAGLLLPGAGGEHLPPRVTGTDSRGARMWPRGPTEGAARTRGRPRAGAGRLAGRGLVRGPRRPAGPQAPTVSERLAAPAALSPPVHSGKADSPAPQRPMRQLRLPGAGSRQRSTLWPPRRGGSGKADAALRGLRCCLGAAPPPVLARVASLPRRERARRGAGPASGAGPALGDCRRVQSRSAKPRGPPSAQ